MAAVVFVQKELTSVDSVRSVVNRDAIAITRRRIVALSSASTDAVVLATGPSAVLFGVSESTALVGEFFNSHLRGKRVVDCGGSFSRGAAITSDGSGRAVSTTTPGDRIIGYASSDGQGIGTTAEIELSWGCLR